MRTNWVREKVRAGQATLGCFMGLGSPNVAELLAHVGFDWLVIETEHNGLDSAEIQQMLMAMNGTDAIPIVRVPSSNHVFIQRALDMGALGIVVPLVKSVEEAQAIVRATRYPPQGTRSFGPLRASHYKLDNEDYFARANDNILVILILETKEMVDDLEAIAAVPGIDVLYLGPMDLALSLGVNPMQPPLPKVDAVIERMLEVGHYGGAAMGMGVSTPDDLRKRMAQGFTFLGYGPDYFMLIDAAQAGLAAFQQQPAMSVGR